MNLGKGSQNHQENGIFWAPPTPEKPISQRTNNNVQPETPQTRTNTGNWNELLGIYSGFLQNEQSNVALHRFDLNLEQQIINDVAEVQQTHIKQQQKPSGDPIMLTSQNYANPNNVQSAYRIAADNGPLQNVDIPRISGLNSTNPNVAGDFSSSDGCRILNQRVNNLLGENTQPQKVDSLAELLSLKTVVQPTLTDQLVRANGCNLHEMPNDRMMVNCWSNYNLNLPPRPEASSSSASMGTQFVPITPDVQKQSKSSYLVINKESHLSINGTPQPSQERQENAAVILSSPQRELILENGQNKILVNTPHDASTTTSASLLKEKSNYPEGGGNIVEIDLNKTPPQKPPKRRKIRPKVVVEGKKPKRNQKPATDKAKTKTTTEPEEPPRPKRKYVRKKVVESPTEPSDLVKASNVGPAKKSCRRSLNFDLNNEAEEEESHSGQLENREENKVPVDSNLFSHDAEHTREFTRALASATLDRHASTYSNGEQQTNVSYSMAQKIDSQESSQWAFAIPQPPHKHNTPNIIARSLNVQSAGDELYDRTNNVNVALVHCAPHANKSESNSHSKRQPPLLQTVPHLMEDVYRSELRQPQDTALVVTTQRRNNELLETGHSDMNNVAMQNGLGKETKDNAAKTFCSTSSSSVPFGSTNMTNDVPEQVQSRWQKVFPPESSITYHKGGSIYPEDKRPSSARNKISESSEVACSWDMGSPRQRHNVQQQLPIAHGHQSAEQIAQKTCSNPGKAQILNSIITLTTNQHMPSASQRATEPSLRNEVPIFPDEVAVKKRTAGQAPSKKVAIIDKSVKKESKSSYTKSSKNLEGLAKKHYLPTIDDIIDRLKAMQISTSGKELVIRDQSALISFRGDGAVVPFEAFDPNKKRIPRPRVELDPETNRLWNLLMGKEGSENAETMDTDKQKWWEEERKIVRGRVDSFIARMHLVQGDRRFSKWKGSVVDSVIGVFLTQNVSDHLSSSAFMSLAAKFPAKSESARRSCSESSRKNNEIRITYPDGTSYDHKMTVQPVPNDSSATPIESSERRTGDTMEGTANILNKHTKMPEDDIVPSRSSIASFTLQNTEGIRSGSGSNSEAEELIFHQQLQNPEPFSSINMHSETVISNKSYHQKSFSSTNFRESMLVLKKMEVDFPTFSRKEKESYLNTTEFMNSRTRVEHVSDIGKGIESSVLGTRTQNGSLKYQQKLGSRQDMNDDNRNRNDGHFTKHIKGGMQESIIDVRASATSPSKHSADPQGNVRIPQTDMGQVDATGEFSDKTTNAATNTRKRKAEKEKPEPINWDTLRVQVESNTGIRERNYTNMDTIDYEVLRNADVREISDAIKERGMNNMLAERIKDFLNRLARDHGKVELEWLRDVQPDKAKDYLLSIRGLGLKSVECVRLLTLHHLAFPVDTNVGRIAVRLGWVPLQPLPESLQLHLLELYPVLESIQKYLWPRLCKLDQETLYELHYQMITFGKVFCTKRDPNCNACPMRAECRHFASAFASARLSLPATEERRIFSSAAPIKSENGSSVFKSHVLLTPVEDDYARSAAPINCNKGSRYLTNPIPLTSAENLERTGLPRNCEPLIEEPTTPEQPVEISERDIEDFFYEDPDEIPVIKLNVEEFATNLQSFMQGKMELGEADMSKALVALNPALASMPVPKLKNISRLRTEHQVYELPDSHPLLKEMDRREPDDPSPYLLAIWTPGETADSVKPPEITCSSQEGVGLCNNKTCFSCNGAKEAQAQTVRGTILIPCRTAMRGSFPLNGTYFQVNEVFADHDSSLNPIDVPRSLLWNLPRRTVFFGTSVSTIFKGMSTEDIQLCFWKGFVCVRGFDKQTRSPRPLRARLHFPASKVVKKNE